MKNAFNRLVFSLFLTFPVLIFAQPETDCVNAFPIQNGNPIDIPFVNGPGNVFDPVHLFSCLVGGEHDTYWLVFECVQSGSFEMMITPDNLSGDYDFALFEGGCPDTGPPVISCDYTGPISPPGPFVPTGISSNPLGTFGVLGLTEWRPTVFLEECITYYIAADNITNNSAGFNIEFAGTAVIGPPNQCLNYPYLVEAFDDCLGEQIDEEECGKVCAYSTGTYTLDLPPDAQILHWEIAGALNFEENGNTIIVDWGAAGGGAMEVTFVANGATFIQDICVNIVAAPEADIQSIPESINEVLEVCQGQTVYFSNGNTEPATYLWNFGDGNFSQSSEPIHAFETAGNFTVTLITGNECVCQDTAQLEVIVVDANLPLIDCIGTVCEGDTATYSSIVDCTNFNWNVSSNGEIVSGGGSQDDFISVVWTGGQLGEVTLAVNDCVGAVCELSASQFIPIISADIPITGTTPVCRDRQHLYSIPQFEGVEIIWSVSEYGTIISGQGTEDIVVEWGNPPVNVAPQWVEVMVENCYLECNGEGHLDVPIQNNFYVTGPLNVCNGNVSEYLTHEVPTDDLVIANWEIQSRQGETVWQSSNATASISVNWDFPVGEYLLIAYPVATENICVESYALFINVIAAIDAPTNILGNFEICPNTYESYQALGNEDDYTFEWHMTNNGQQQILEGEFINVLWENPPYGLSVRYVSGSGLGCVSDFISQNITFGSQLTMEGPTAACVNNISTYTVTTMATNPITYDLIPSSMGSIIDMPTPTTVEILWHEAGEVSLFAQSCGGVDAIDITISEAEPPKIIHPDTLCPNQTTIINTLNEYTAYNWKNSDGLTISTSPTPNIGAGTYELEVTNEAGCISNEIFTIIEAEIPIAEISGPSYAALCPNGPPAILYALNSNDNWTYEWFLNGVSTGNTNPVYSTNQVGTYSLVVTNSLGCSITSGGYSLVNCVDINGNCVDGLCLPPGGGNPAGDGCTNNGNISFNYTQGQICQVLNFNNTSLNFVPGSFNWNFGDPNSGVNNTSNAENPTHTFTQPGWYTVVLIADIYANNPQDPPCPRLFFQDIPVGVQAKIDYEPACPNEETFFTDASIYLPDDSPVAWQWDFGDPNSGAANFSNLQDPSHAFSEVGNFPVTLTVTGQNGCQSTATTIVSTHPLPEFNFAVPLVGCSNFSVDLVATSLSNIVEYSWDFGDPNSGNANFSDSEITAHVYQNPGNYVISLTTTSVFGCTKTIENLITIEDNAGSGEIIAQPESPICLGDTTTLMAPDWGGNWLWSTGEITQQITASQAGIYEVTATDAAGCEYIPQPLILDILPSPDGIIQAVEFGEFGEPTGITFDFYEICEGEDVVLQVVGDADNTYQWSDGTIGDELLLTEERDALLEAGVYTFSVDVTDQNSGCVATVGPMEVVVNELPEVQITADGQPPFCEFTPVTFSVLNPNGGYTYRWNNGATGTTMTTEKAGEFFAIAINAQGCENPSNAMEILTGPNIYKIPSGCYEKCRPDTICLPSMPEIVSFQWFLNDSPIPAPEGTIANLVAMESGEYYVHMIDENGCENTSEILTLDLYDGIGTVQGIVAYDVNENGVFDVGDTLVNHVNIALLNNGMEVNSTTTANGNGFIFQNIPGADYEVELDTMTIPLGMQIFQFSQNAELIGCDNTLELLFLLEETCLPSFENISFETCEGSSIVFENETIEAGETATIFLSNFDGCDSIITVEVDILLKDSTDLNLMACAGETIDFNGQILNAGETTEIILQNQHGCDSTLFVEVEALQPDIETVNLSACEGTIVDYLGQELAAGSETIFDFQNVHGCDSTVTVLVEALLTESSNLTLFTCQNEAIVFNGTNLEIGEQMDFTLQNQNGCDSIVSVNVEGFEVQNSIQNLNVCEGDTAYFNNTPVFDNLAEFTFSDQNGCDSLVTVLVETLSPSASEISFTACENEFIEYQNQPVEAGTQMDFILQNHQGCDSVVTVSVETLVASSANLELEICEGEEITYEGTMLTAGAQMDFTLINQAGCDSIVSVSVLNYPAASFDLAMVESCPNEQNGIIQIVDIQSNSNDLQFSLDGINFQNEATFENLPSGNYSVFLQSEHGCIFENETTIPALPSIEANLPLTFLNCDKSAVELFPMIEENGVENLTFEWNNGITERSISITEPGDYWVEITSKCESKRLQTTVEIASDGQNDFLFIPNCFSPNGDGVNDELQVFTWQNVEILSFEWQIFDRWGNQLYIFESLEDKWDGRYRNKMMNPAVFVYWLRADVRYCGRQMEIFKKGDVVLMR